MEYFTIHIELDKRNPTGEAITQLLELLSSGQFSPAVGTSPRGYLEARVSVPSQGLVQAVMTTVATVQQLAGATAVHVDAMTEKEFDLREGQQPVPAILGVSEASEETGYSPQRLHQMMDEGKLTKIRIGVRGVALLRSEVDVLKRRRAEAAVGVNTDRVEGETAAQYTARLMEHESSAYPQHDATQRPQVG